MTIASDAAPEPPDLNARLDAVWQLAALARAVGGEPDAMLTALSATLAQTVGLNATGLTHAQRTHLVAEIRTNLRQAATLAEGASVSGWDPDDATLLSQGRASRRVAVLITELVAGQFPQMRADLAAAGAQFLDVGVGVAQISIEMCHRVPLLRATGIDVNPRPLRLAAAEVTAAELSERIELRHADIADLTDSNRFTLAWIPMPFLSPQVVEPGLRAVYRALRPHGWLLAACAPPDADRATATMNQLRAGILGGGHHTADTVAAALTEIGYTDIHKLPPAPGAPPALVLARTP